jgi:putative transposase
VRFKDEFNIPESVEFRNVTISRENNQYFASICYDTHIQIPEKSKIEKEKTLGIDLGITTLMALSDNTKIENPKHLKKYEKKLAEEQRKLPTKELTETKEIDTDGKKIKISSKRRNKQILKVQKIYKKISNVRKDFLHKLTTNLVENQNWTSYCMEDLNVKKMQQENYTPMARAISDVAWSTTLSMMEYKCNERGKNLILIGRFDASSKTCNVCGNIYHELERDEKVWTCNKCETFHDRDLNASLNIKNFGIIKSLGKSFGEDLSEPRTTCL